MSLNDDLRALSNEIRRIPDDLGLRHITVTIRTESHSVAVGVSGDVITPTDVVLSPVPRVKKLDDGEASLYGGGHVDEGMGRTTADVYEIGPVTRTNTYGGYTIAQLIPSDATPTARPLVVLGGDTFAAAGDLFRIVSIDDSNPRLFTFRVQRAASI